MQLHGEKVTEANYFRARFDLSWHSSIPLHLHSNMLIVHAKFMLFVIVCICNLACVSSLLYEFVLKIKFVLLIVPDSEDYYFKIRLIFEVVILERTPASE